MKWLERTLRSYETAKKSNHRLNHTKEWLTHTMDLLSERLIKGAYDQEWIDLYLQEALKKGIKEVGIVEHLYRFKETRNYFEGNMRLDGSDIGQLQSKWLNQVMTENMEEFLVAIEKAKKRWQNYGVTLRVGIEADYFEGAEGELHQLLGPIECDFINGSIHFIDGWGFDNPQTQAHFQEYVLEDLYVKFFSVVQKGIESGLFDYMSHLDNIKVFNHIPKVESLLPFYHIIAECLIQHNVATEVNSGLYYRFPVKEKCPGRTFMSILASHGVPFTVSSDAHFPEDLGAYVDQSIRDLLNSGVTEIATFNQRKRIMKPLQISVLN
ncbi:histidinol-phosphatase (PHP family) [Bacillus pakistanensis]|uniref:Histidinol-phosphatase n=2 Tax=Rossellomorea pakistanensis TaxID=992288 RepID=A0ABS2NJK8_9BACI|nr:histidinol-phosphatase (PHP family) [Bacillus pakistanensis]